MSTLANYYNNFYKKLSRIDALHNSFSKIESFVSDIPVGAKILDIGCGYGSVSYELIKKGYEVYGMEINNDAIEALKQKGFKVIEQDITQPFKIKEKLDLVLLLDILEHVFEPMFLIGESIKVLKENGQIIISVPLYFDIIDRIRILFSGSIISYDNLCYGKEIYKKLRSYNYDHIRFFRPREIFEMCKIYNLKLKQVEYLPCMGIGIFSAKLMKIIANKYTANLLPNLFAHSMVIKIQK